MRPEKTSVSHTGEERYEAMLQYGPEQMGGIRQLTKDGQIVPDTIRLVWTRRVGEKWQRQPMAGSGSAAIGHVKIEGVSGAVGPRKSREIFTRDLGDIRAWAQYLPGLRSAIEDVEAELPDARWRTR